MKLAQCRRGHHLLFIVAVTACSAGSRDASVGSTSQALDVAIATYQVPPDADGTGPFDITAGADGNLYYTALYDHVGRITTAGVITTADSTDDAPVALTLGPGSSPTLWGTGDGVGIESPLIWQLTSSGTQTWSLRPSYVSDAIATGLDGALWFTEVGGAESNGGLITVADIGHITTDGTLTYYPLPNDGDLGGAPNGLPGRITAGPDGAMWFTNVWNSAPRVGRIDVTTHVVTEYFIPDPSSYSFSNTGWIATGPDGALWVSGANGYLFQVTTAGVITPYALPSSYAATSGLTAGPDGALWFLEWDSMSARVGRLTMAGGIAEYALPATGGASNNGQPDAITLGPDGNLWYTQGGDIVNPGIPTIGTIVFAHSPVQVVSDCSSFAGDGLHGTSLKDALTSLPAAGGSITFTCGNVIDAGSIAIPTSNASTFANQKVSIQVSLGVTTPVEISAKDPATGVSSGPTFVVAPGAELDMTSITIDDGLYAGIINEGTLNLIFSTVRNTNGVGLSNLAGGTAVLDTSTIANNTNGIAFGAPAGGIYNEGTLTLSAATIAANASALGLGTGGLYTNGGTTNVISTIIANNTGVSQNCNAPVVDLGHNLESAASEAASECGLSAANNDVFGNPLLVNAGLSSANPFYASYAVPIWTWAISVAPSGITAAYNNGALSACNGTDQRGWGSASRQHPCAAGICCSIGAYEPDASGL